MPAGDAPKRCPQAGWGHVMASSETVRWQAGHVFKAGTPSQTESTWAHALSSAQDALASEGSRQCYSGIHSRAQWLWCAEAAAGALAPPIPASLVCCWAYWPNTASLTLM